MVLGYHHSNCIWMESILCLLGKYCWWVINGRKEMPTNPYRLLVLKHTWGLVQSQAIQIMNIEQKLYLQNAYTKHTTSLVVNVCGCQASCGLWLFLALCWSRIATLVRLLPHAVDVSTQSTTHMMAFHFFILKRGSGHSWLKHWVSKFWTLTHC